MLPTSLPKLNGLTSWLFGRAPEYRGLIMGFDAAGKTTLLYQLKLPNETITTHPTIGFNVESVASSKGTKFTMWDVGGCDKLRPLYRHYFQNTHVFFFVVDCSDTSRFDDVIPEIRSLLNEVARESGERNLWIVLNKQDLLPPQSRDEVVKGMKSKLEDGLSRHVESGRVRIFGPSGFNAFEHGHVSALLDEVADVMQGAIIPKPPTKKLLDVYIYERSHMSQTVLYERVKENMRENPASADTFWRGFLNADLPVWNHYNHLRAGYFVLLEGFACGHGIMKCADMFIDHLEILRAKKPERFRNTAHRTMTIFWLFQLHVVALKYQISRHMEGLPSRGEFDIVLLTTPDPIDSDLWKRYYSKDLMFSPNARANWVLPQFGSLPSITQSSEYESSSERVPKADNDHIIRFALTIVQTTSGTELRRGAVIKLALSALQTSIMQERALIPTMAPYSETQAYFWIQFVHAAIASLPSGSGAGLTPASGWHGSMNTLTPTAFKALFDISGEEWRSYYSVSLWDSMKARIGFVNPDKKPLPGLISIPPQAKTNNVKLHMVFKAGLGITTTPRMPPPESLAVLVAAVCDAAALSDCASIDGLIKTHAELIVFLYETLVAQVAAKTESDGSLVATSKRQSDIARAIDEALEVSGPSFEGLTRKMFWIQQVLVAAEQTVAPSSFDNFMNSNPHLAYEGLPLMYYSEMILNSSEANEVFMAPDRRPFPSVVSGGKLQSV